MCWHRAKNLRYMTFSSSERAMDDPGAIYDVHHEGHEARGQGSPCFLLRHQVLVQDLLRASSTHPSPSSIFFCRLLSSPHLHRLSLIRNATNHLLEEASERGLPARGGSLSYFPTSIEAFSLRIKSRCPSPLVAVGNDGDSSRGELGGPQLTEALESGMVTLAGFRKLGLASLLRLR